MSYSFEPLEFDWQVKDTPWRKGDASKREPGMVWGEQDKEKLTAPRPTKVPKSLANIIISKTDAERAMVVLVDSNGNRQPFYLSSGAGGKVKDGVAVGKWYPFFGSDEGWIKKGSGAAMARYYDSPEFERMGKWLDENVGNIVGDKEALARAEKRFGPVARDVFHTKGALPEQLNKGGLDFGRDTPVEERIRMIQERANKVYPVDPNVTPGQPARPIIPAQAQVAPQVTPGQRPPPIPGAQPGPKPYPLPASPQTPPPIPGRERPPIPFSTPPPIPGATPPSGASMPGRPYAPGFLAAAADQVPTGIDQFDRIERIKRVVGQIASGADKFAIIAQRASFPFEIGSRVREYNVQAGGTPQGYGLPYWQQSLNNAAGITEAWANIPTLGNYDMIKDGAKAIISTLMGEKAPEPSERSKGLVHLAGELIWNHSKQDMPTAERQGVWPGTTPTY